MSTNVSMTMPIEAAERDLKQLLEQLHLGDSVTLVGPEGTPWAVVVSLKSVSGKARQVPDWQERWDALAQEISRAWKSDNSAVEILTEMRR